MPMHTPLWQVSPVVQALPSSHGVRSGSGVPAQTPPWQVSLLVQALPSSPAAPVMGVTVQLDVPLQVRVLHVSEVHVMAVPTHSPLLEQVSLYVQALPSSHVAPVFGVTVQLAVPLQVRVLHASEVHVTAVLWQTPASQVSTVQAFPSLPPLAVQVSVQVAGVPSWQAPASLGLAVQAALSLQVGAVEACVVQATAVLWQTPASQESVVQAFPSLQSATVVQGVQPAIAVFWQTPPEQESVVQAFWSLQSAAVEQSVQPARAVPAHCPLPSQTSLKVQALPSSHGVSAGRNVSGEQGAPLPAHT